MSLALSPVTPARIRLTSAGFMSAISVASGICGRMCRSKMRRYGGRGFFELVHVALHPQEITGEMMERLDLEEVGNIRSEDATPFDFRITQTVGIDDRLIPFARDGILDGHTRLIAPVLAFDWHNKTPPRFVVE